jgi:hypothetical protein
MSDRLAEAVILEHYTATVNLGRQIKDFEIVGAWSAEDMENLLVHAHRTTLPQKGSS